MGPQGFQDYHQVYVRTAVSVDPSGWAHFEYVKLPEYRWGIFLADPVHDRRIGFGDFMGQPVWQEVPGRVPQPAAPPGRHAGRHRAGERRAAAVARPALPEPLRPAQPVPGERRGRPSPLGDGLPAALVLRPRRPRRSGGAARAPERQPRQAAHPRRLQRADRELARLLHVHDVHRPRRQVAAAVAVGELARSAVADDAVHADRGSAPHVRRRDRHRAHPRAHLPADEAGRLLRATCGSSAASTCRRIQKFINFWFSQSLDLHGNEVSTNAASYFANGLKGRAEEDKWDDHNGDRGALRARHAAATAGSSASRSRCATR